MTNPFDRPEKHGTVRGVDVCARPMPFGVVRKMMQAESDGDDSARLLVMADAVAENVRLASGEKIDVDAIDSQTIAELFAFAVRPEANNGAGFTSPASPAGAAETVTQSPQTT